MYINILTQVLNRDIIQNRRSEMFSKTELKVMAKLLNLASERSGNDTCNDFELPLTPENLLLVKLADTENQPYVNHGGSIIANDCVLMDYFRKRCEEEASRGVGNR